MAHSRLSSIPLLVLAVLALGACAGDEARSVSDQLRACGLMSEGHVTALPFYVPNDCYDSCLRTAGCAELEDALCGESIDLLIRCDERCAFRCPESGLIAVERVCNGFDDCSDGADEEGCPTFRCADGVILSKSRRCNGGVDCADASDERDCPPPACDGSLADPDCPSFQCADGTQQPPYVRCDGWTACSDGSDEVGCAEITAMCESE